MQRGAIGTVAMTVGEGSEGGGVPPPPSHGTTLVPQLMPLPLVCSGEGGRGPHPQTHWFIGNSSSYTPRQSQWSACSHGRAYVATHPHTHTCRHFGWYVGRGEQSSQLLNRCLGMDGLNSTVSSPVCMQPGACRAGRLSAIGDIMPTQHAVFDATHQCVLLKVKRI